MLMQRSRFFLDFDFSILSKKIILLKCAPNFIFQDFEKGLLADLFPSSSVVQPAEKLLDDLDLVSQDFGLISTFSLSLFGP